MEFNWYIYYLYGYENDENFDNFLVALGINGSGGFCPTVLSTGDN